MLIGSGSSCEVSHLPSPIHGFLLNLEAHALSHRYGSIRALDAVSLRASAGEVVGVIGPNGAGKSTLLACVAGLVAPDAGRVSLDGVDTDAVERRRALFYLPDGIAPWRDQPAEWVLDFAAELFGAAEPWRNLSSSLAIEPFARQRMGELSKGQRKRVLLTLALAVARPVVLIDEPFDGLDPRQARAFTSLVRERAGAGRTCILSVHSMGDATRTCDRHVLLHEGRVVADGPLDALLHETALPDSAGLEDVFLALT
jgi:ABC-type multidrug transport system ATPase subunit